MSLPVKLTMQLQGSTDVVFQRFFDAEPTFLFDCHTEPESVRRWMGDAQGWALTTCQIDLRPGGRFVYIWQKEGEGSFGFGGVHHEIQAPTRLVSKEVFIPDPSNLPDLHAANGSINTLHFAPEQNGTLMTLTCRYSSEEEREAALQSRSVEGMELTYSQLGRLNRT